MRARDRVRALMAGAHERRRRYLAAAAQAAQGWYGPDGRWLAPTRPAEARERLWTCFALYAGTEAQRRLADAVVLATRLEPFPDGHRFDIFTSNIAPILYAAHRERISPEAGRCLLELTREGHHDFPGDRQADYHFHGYNDNMPAKGTMSLIVGGELLGDERAVAHGLWQLRQLQDELTRNGVNSEYTSPTYSPLTLHAMAAIRNFSSRAEAVERAAGIERRLWADLACHWHPESRQFAGPHSRAYTRDHVGHVSEARALLWQVLGERVTGISPMLYFGPPPDWLLLHHAGDLPFNISCATWFVAGDYRLDENLAKLFLRKPASFGVTATAEHGESFDKLPARRVICTTLMTPDYSLGTATVPFCGGEQTDTFYVTCTQDDDTPVGSTVYLKYSLDDERPGAIVEEGGCSGESDHQTHHAANVTLQHGPAALLSCRPHATLAGRALRRLALTVILPTHLHQVDELIVGDRPVTDWSGEFDGRTAVGLRRGRCCLALRPLAYIVGGEPARLRLMRHEKYCVISIENYSGEPRAWTEQELMLVLNGFAAETAGRDEAGGLAGLMAALREAAVEDYYLFGTRRMRYLRPARDGREGVELALCYSPGSLQWRYALANGRQIEAPPWRATGLPPARLPFLTAPYEPRPAGIPWKSLKVFWYDRIWHIHERGDGA